MATIARTYGPATANPVATGSTILAAHINTDLDTVYSDYNGNITNANIAAAAAIAASKLSFTNGIWRTVATPWTAILSLSGVSTTADTDIDLTANTSATATHVMLKVVIDNTNTTEGSYVRFRAKGATTAATQSVLLYAPQVSSFHAVYPCVIVPMDSNQVITYDINSNAGATSVNAWVIGYKETT